jgi:uncharacterized protein
MSLSPSLLPPALLRYGRRRHCVVRTSVTSSQRRQHACSSRRCIDLSTRNWLEQVVIREKLCPFAPPLLQSPGLLRIVSSNATSDEEAIIDVAHEVQLLMDNGNDSLHETTLVVLDHPAFVHDFRDFVRLSWKLQEEAIGATYLNQLQLVLFHPRATHQTYGAGGQDDDDDAAAADYTIRSPHPTIHLLREQDVLRAVTSGYPHLDTLPDRNKAKFIAQGLDICKARLADCHVVDTPLKK